MKQKLEDLNKKFREARPEEVLGFVLKEHPGKAAFSTSLGSEDQVLTDMIAKIDKGIKIFTLDTGRQFYETYDTLDKTNGKYDINIEILFPDAQEVEIMVKEKGINLFYDSIENRRFCCNLRKLKPLKRALKGYEVWITGIRREQSVTRKNVELFEWDEELQIVKISPIINWSEKEVWNYIRAHKVPYNILHDKGYPSIGCAPCTRAVEKGENSRNGRWWWENSDTKECGIHLHVKTS